MNKVFLIPIIVENFIWLVIYLDSKSVLKHRISAKEIGFHICEVSVKDGNMRTDFRVPPWNMFYLVAQNVICFRNAHMVTCFQIVSWFQFWTVNYLYGTYDVQCRNLVIKSFDLICCQWLKKVKPIIKCKSSFPRTFNHKRV